MLWEESIIGTCVKLTMCNADVSSLGAGSSSVCSEHGCGARVQWGWHRVSEWGSSSR